MFDDILKIGRTSSSKRIFENFCDEIGEVTHLIIKQQAWLIFS
jgi:hypothetical protein